RVPDSPSPLLKILCMDETHTGGCYCGAVEVEATGEPLNMGYGHCNECRRYCTAPVSIFTLWKPETVKVGKGEQYLGKFHASELSDRRYCTKCGGHVMIDHPPSAWRTSAFH